MGEGAIGCQKDLVNKLIKGDSVSLLGRGFRKPFRIVLSSLDGRHSDADEKQN